MKRREGRISIISLLLLTAITIGLMIIELNSKTKVEARYYAEKIDAARTAQHAFSIIKERVIEIGMPIDRINDPNETGLIGLQYSPITTERGDLEAQLTSTNPNFAALIVEFLRKSRVQRGDTAAVLLTGSYPALNIAVLSAVKTLGLQAVITTSLSASMWGANFPQLTYLDMETLLISSGIFDYKSALASLGGEEDLGRGLSPAGREMIVDAAQRNNVPLLEANDLDDAISKKMTLYDTSGSIKVFINAGERATCLAGSETGNGLISGYSIKTGQGLAARFSKRGITVINLIDIEKLALENDLPPAPIPLPKPGDGRLFHEYKYSVTMAMIAVLILVVILFIVLRYDIDYYLKRSKK